jgi:hypothetical protein
VIDISLLPLAFGATGGERAAPAELEPEQTPAVL